MKRHTYALNKSSPDLRAFSIQGNGHRSVLNATRSKTLSGFTDILDGFSMVLHEKKVMYCKIKCQCF